MFDVSPSFYAKDTRPREFRLRGGNLDMIPADAVGIYATDNEDPLQYLHSQQPWRRFTIAEQSDMRMTLRHEQESVLTAPVYLGAIVSRDGENVYWTNTSKPLP